MGNAGLVAHAQSLPREVDALLDVRDTKGLWRVGQVARFDSTLGAMQRLTIVYADDDGFLLNEDFELKNPHHLGRLAEAMGLAVSMADVIQRPTITGLASAA